MNPTLSAVVFIAVNAEVIAFVALVCIAMAIMIQFAKWFDDQLP